MLDFRFFKSQIYDLKSTSNYYHNIEEMQSKMNQSGVIGLKIKARHKEKNLT